MRLRGWPAFIAAMWLAAGTCAEDVPKTASEVETPLPKVFVWIGGNGWQEQRVVYPLSDAGLFDTEFWIQSRSLERSRLPRQANASFHFTKKQFHAFDVVVLVDPQATGTLRSPHYRNDTWGEALRDYVKEGGHVVYIAGFAHTKDFISDVRAFPFLGTLPLRITAHDLAGGGGAKMKPDADAEHRKAPGLRLAENDKQNDEYWQATKPIRLAVAAGDLADDSSVLVHAGLEGERLPLLARRRFGKGTSAMLTSPEFFAGIDVYGHSTIFWCNYIHALTGKGEKMQPRNAAARRLKEFDPSYDSEVIARAMKSFDESRGKRREADERSGESLASVVAEYEKILNDAKATVSGSADRHVQISRYKHHALTALALMASGTTLSKGSHRKRLNDAVANMLATNLAKEGRAMSHAYRLMVTAILQGTSPETAVNRKMLESAEQSAALLVNSLQHKDGGFAGDGVLPSIDGTLRVLTSMLVAREAGVDVSEGAIRRAFIYLFKRRLKSGGIARSETGDEPDLAWSAWAVVCHKLAGDLDGKSHAKLIAYVREATANPKQLKAQTFGVTNEELFYLAVAIKIVHPDRFRTILQPIVRDIIDQQNKDGSTTVAEGGPRDTMFAVLLLKVYSSDLHLPF